MNRLFQFLGWAKVQKGKKTIMWWYHKVLCEIGYWLYSDFNMSQKMYYKHLKGCVDNGFNLYGQPF